MMHAGQARAVLVDATLLLPRGVQSTIRDTPDTIPGQTPLRRAFYRPSARRDLWRRGAQTDLFSLYGVLRMPRAIPCTLPILVDCLGLSC